MADVTKPQTQTTSRRTQIGQVMQRVHAHSTSSARDGGGDGTADVVGLSICAEIFRQGHHAGRSKRITPYLCQMLGDTRCPGTEPDFARSERIELFGE